MEARLSPTGTVLAGSHARLEPLSRDHLGDLFDALNRPGHEKDWTYLAAGPFTSRPPFDEFMLTTDAMLRYEWKCDVLNERSRRAAERLGFTYEGTWRNAQVCKGRNRDTAWYAMTDEDWRAS